MPFTEVSIGSGQLWQDADRARKEFIPGAHIVDIDPARLLDNTSGVGAATIGGERCQRQVVGTTPSIGLASDGSIEILTAASAGSYYAATFLTSTVVAPFLPSADTITRIAIRCKLGRPVEDGFAFGLCSPSAIGDFFTTKKNDHAAVYVNPGALDEPFAFTRDDGGTAETLANTDAPIQPGIYQDIGLVIDGVSDYYLVVGDRGFHETAPAAIPVTNAMLPFLIVKTGDTSVATFNFLRAVCTQVPK